jgi:hypothetical protein
MREYAGGQPQQADGGAAAQSLDLRTANLTQELSQLLAQTIAHTQSGKPTPGAAATGTQFTNLVALVSTATQTQRSHQPSFRDGLSSLAYTRPQPPAPPSPAPILAAPEPSLVAAPAVFAASATGFAAPGNGFMAPLASGSNGLLVSEPHDEEPMPIPSTWRQPTHGDDDKWYRQQLGAAGLGLLAGLVVVVPAVLWLSGFLGGGSQAKSARVGHDGPTVKVAEVKAVKVAAATTVEPRIGVTPPSAPVVEPVAPPTQSRAIVVEPPPSAVAVVPVPKSVEPPRSRVDDLLAQAKRRIEGSDVAGARDILQEAPETAASAAMIFLLAETYDPNMLASWQTRGVTANPERARALYQKARDLGDSRAQQRLDWLTAN